MKFEKIDNNNIHYTERLKINESQIMSGTD